MGKWVGYCDEHPIIVYGDSTKSGSRHTHLPITPKIDETDSIGYRGHPIGYVVYLRGLEWPMAGIPMRAGVDEPLMCAASGIA